MERQRRASSAGPPEIMRRTCSRRSLRMSSRMKKVAPPPPPPMMAPPPPPLLNGKGVGGGVRSTPGEDSAFDEMLEGRMDLQVVLPDLKVVHMTVDRRTPMMDLLVQATTINKISPGGHIINVISKDERNVSYKPNTPIGSLDASNVYIIPKSTLELPVKRMPKLANQPFEQTFRLQVNLPHNQRMVLRVSPRITLAELKSQICSEKELDHSNHHLVHPAQPDTILDLNATLEVYGCAEISLMSNSGLRDSIRTNIFPIPKIEEERKKKGILRLFSRKKKDFSIETINGSLPTSHSDTTLNRNSYQPKQSIKRKPAPAPPPVFNSSPPLITQSSNSINSRPESEISVKTADEIESSVSHSRHSSDSSGYHEPSVFSDCSENKSPEASIVHSDSVDATRQSSPLFKDYPENGVTLKRSSMTARDTNLKHVPSCSNVSISSASRKRKAPQPPLSTLPAIESPSSPDPPTEGTSDTNPGNAVNSAGNAQNDTGNASNGTGKAEAPVISASESEKGSVLSVSDSVQQESEALQYLEDVLQESENCVRNFSSQRVLDDSDTDSLKDEGEVISVCQAEIHANDQDSSDSVVEPPTVVIPDPALPKSSFAPPSTPNSQPEVCEVLDTSADDSGISQSLTSDADSSVPSINSDLRTDSRWQEEIYCNVAGGVITASYSTPVIASPKSRVELHSHVPIPLPRLSLKRKVLTSMGSLDSSIYPSCDSLDVKSVPSSAEFNAEECNVDVENRAKTDSLENKSIGESSSTCPSTMISATSIVETVLTESIPIVPEKQNSSTPEMLLTSDETTPIQPVQSSGQDNEKLESKCDTSNSDRNSVTSSLSMDSAHNSTTHTPQLQRKLDNFALGCYRKEEDIDIYSAPSPEHKLSNGVTNQQSFRTEIKAPLRKGKTQPDVKISSFKERNQVDGSLPSENGHGKVLEKCAQLSNMSTLPLTGRSTSLFNLAPQKKFQRVVANVEESEETVNGGMKRTYSDQNVAKDLEPVELKETFLNEQRRLQEEYRRLQEQFISWQKQLLSNQSLLQNEKIVPQMPFPSLEGLTSLDSNVVNIAYENPDKPKSDTNASFNDLRTRSLPRPKTKPLSLKEQSRAKSPPLAQPLTEVSVVDIDISVQEPAKRPESLNSCSVNTQADFNQDKVTQVPSPQDKNTQVPSPQEKVTCSTQAPSPPNVLNKDTSAQTSETIQASDAMDVSSNSLSSPESDKSQTLPRHKPKPISALQPSRTMTLNRNTRPKSQVVSVTIGSWQQRQTPISEIEPSSSVASTRSKFLSLENIPQSSMKSVPSTMERRKLPPVPIEVESLVETAPKTLPKFVEAKTVPNVSKPESVKPKSTTTEVKSVHVDKKPTRTHSINDTKVLKTVPKQIDEVPQKQKSEIRLASREPTATFKLAKPFVKLSSMKDEPHQPSIIGLRKWPLAESDSKQSSILDDLKASSKKPGGYVQEKIRRAEVDLRKPKSKAEPVPGPKPPKHDNPEASKLHITKVSINNPKAIADSNEPLTLVKNTTSTPVVTTTTTSTSKSNHTVPKSKSLNSELMSVFSKKASRNVEISKQNETAIKSAQVVTVNGGVQQSAPPPPPPPPPPMASSSTMPTIPPAEQIPVSSQLVMARGKKTLPATRKESKKSPTKFSRTSDPREELMLEIRGFGGKQALRKAPSSQAGWHLKVYGTATKANM